MIIGDGGESIRSFIHIIARDFPCCGFHMSDILAAATLDLKFTLKGRKKMDGYVDGKQSPSCHHPEYYVISIKAVMNRIPRQPIPLSPDRI